MPEKARWQNLKDLKHDIGDHLDNAIEEIEEKNKSLKGVFDHIDYSLVIGLAARGRRRMCLRICFRISLASG